MRGLARGIQGECGAPYLYTASASCVSMRPDDFGQNHMVGSGHLRAAAAATAELQFEDVVAWHTLLTHGCVARYEAAARKGFERRLTHAQKRMCDQGVGRADLLNTSTRRRELALFGVCNEMMAKSRCDFSRVKSDGTHENYTSRIITGKTRDVTPRANV